MPLGDPTPVRAVRLSDGLMERVDGVRGEMSRSEFVRRAVEAHVDHLEAYLHVAELTIPLADDAQPLWLAERR